MIKYAFVLSFSILAYLLATDIYTPSMPEIGRFFGASDDEVQRTMSYFLLGSVITCITAGLFADQIGKKRFLMWGMVLAVVGSLLTLTATTIDGMILGRFIQGLGSGAGPVIGYAAAQELLDPKGQAKFFLINGIVIATLPAVAPLLGGIISAHLGWHLIFVTMGVLFLITTIAIAYYLPDTLDIRQPHTAKGILSSYGQILSSRTFLALALISPMYASVEWFYLTFLPFYMQKQIGTSPEFYGFIASIIIPWYAAGTYLGNRMLHYYGMHTTIMLGLITGVISAALLWGVTLIAPLSTLWITIGLSIFLLAFGILYPSSVSGSLQVFPNNITRASSVRSLAITGFAFIGSFAAELMDDSKLSSLSNYTLFASVVAWLIYMMRDRKNAS